MKIKKTWLELLITSLMFGMFSLFYIVFMSAYFSTAKMARVYINSFGEANIEVVIINVLMLLFLGFVLYKLNNFVLACKAVRQ